jgi:hypothetical protein
MDLDDDARDPETQGLGNISARGTYITRREPEDE